MKWLFHFLHGKKLRRWVGAIFFVGILLIFIPWMLIQPSFSGIDFSNSGQIGDTIGGTTAPFIGFLGAILTFAAFYIQFEANRQIRSDIERDRFESKFYELLRLQKENLNEIDIAGRHRGRKAFVKIYEEYRFCYVILEKIYEKQYAHLNLDRERLLELSFNYFFFGVGPNSNLATEKLEKGKEKKLLVKFRKRLSKYQDSFEEHRLEKIENRQTLINHPFEKSVASKKNKANLEITYYPFDGHVSKLGHYYRHLYQTVRFVAANERLGLGWREKYQYIKMLRAQLSNHEQTMLYYNSFFVVGKPWWGEKVKTILKNGRIDHTEAHYFLDYRVVRNIPFYLATFGKAPKVKFREELIKVERLTNEKSIERRLTELLEWY